MVIGDVLALVMGFRKVMLTSPPEWAHCGGGVKAVWTMSKVKLIFLTGASLRRCRINLMPLAEVDRNFSCVAIL